MKLSKFKCLVSSMEEISFQLENGETIPQHFHITEIGVNSKKYIDCGGKIRLEKVINFQLWYSNDFDHKLEPKKVLDIISLAEKALSIEDLEIEVEYQNTTIGKYNLKINGSCFVLESKTTACLAEDKCGIPEEKLKVSLSDLQSDSSCCSPDSGCC